MINKGLMESDVSKLEPSWNSKSSLYINLVDSDKKAEN